MGSGNLARELSRQAPGSDASEWWTVCRKLASKDAGSKVEMDPWPLTPWLMQPFAASDPDSLYSLPLQVRISDERRAEAAHAGADERRAEAAHAGAHCSPLLPTAGSAAYHRS